MKQKAQFHLIFHSEAETGPQLHQSDPQYRPYDMVNSHW